MLLAIPADKLNAMTQAFKLDKLKGELRNHSYMPCDAECSPRVGLSEAFQMTVP